MKAKKVFDYPVTNTKDADNLPSESIFFPPIVFLLSTFMTHKIWLAFIHSFIKPLIEYLLVEESRFCNFAFLSFLMITNL